MADQFRALLSRKTYEARITKIRDEAKKQQTKRVAVLTRTAQAELVDLEAMVDRDLQDDAVQAYDEALKEARLRRARRQRDVQGQPARLVSRSSDREA